MNIKQKQALMLRGILPFSLALALYYFTAVFMAQNYGMPEPKFMTLIKYLLSTVAAEINFTWGTFNCPIEYADFYAQKYGITTVPVYYYFLFVADVIKPEIYTRFPSYFLVAFLASVGNTIYGLSKITKEAEKQTKDVYVRGAKLLDPKAFCKASQKSKDIVVKIPTKTGELCLSNSSLKTHALVLGTTGSGKSQLLLSIMQCLAPNFEQGLRCVIIDRKGEFFAHFGREKDVIINPYDKRGEGWSIFNELKAEKEPKKMPADYVYVSDIICQTLNTQNKDPYWSQAASSVLQSGLAYCVQNGTTDTRSLVNFLNQKVEDILTGFETLPLELKAGAGAIGKADSNKADSVVGVCRNSIRQLAVFAEKHGDFSVRQWAKNGEGNLYISTAGGNDASYSTIITLMIDLIGREVKQFPDAGGQNLRLLFVVDELAALPPIATLGFLLREARSKGVGVIVANQSFAKIKDAYGEAAARDILLNCKSRFFFCLPEAGDASYVSQTIGKAEYERTERTRALSDGKNGGTTITTSKKYVQDDLILPATIASLPVGSAATQLAALAGMSAIIPFLPAKVSQKPNEEFKKIETQEYYVTTNKEVWEQTEPKKEQEKEQEKEPKKEVEIVFDE